MSILIQYPRGSRDVQAQYHANNVVADVKMCDEVGVSVFNGGYMGLHRTSSRVSFSKSVEGTESGGLAHRLDAVVVRDGAEYEHDASHRIPESRYYYRYLGNKSTVEDCTR